MTDNKPLWCWGCEDRLYWWQSRVVFLRRVFHFQCKYAYIQGMNDQVMNLPGSATAPTDAEGESE